jgi:hypothetical protein
MRGVGCRTYRLRGRQEGLVALLLGCFRASKLECGVWNVGRGSTLETTQGQVHGFFGQLPFKFYLPEVASMGD